MSKDWKYCCLELDTYGWYCKMDIVHMITYQEDVQYHLCSGLSCRPSGSLKMELFNFKNCKENFWLKELQVWGNTPEESFNCGDNIYLLTSFNSMKSHVHSKCLSSSLQRFNYTHCPQLHCYQAILKNFLNKWKIVFTGTIDNTV